MLQFFGLILMLFFTSLSRGLVLVKLWIWFVMPTFPGAPKLTVPVALGISLLMSYLTGSLSSKSDSDNSGDFWDNVTASCLKSLLIALFALFMGWIYTLFM